MSEENVEIVRKGLDAGNAFARGELSQEALAQIVDPQVEFHWHDERTLPGVPQHLRGVPGFLRWVGETRETWSDLTWEPLEFIDAPGDRILTLTSQSGRGRESGVPIVIHFFALFTIRDGKLRKVEFFRHRVDALEAAGLSG
jgi:ketosteroid isomerase-like protein